MFLSLVSSLSLHDGLRSCRSVESPVRLAFDAIEEVEPEVKDKDTKLEKLNLIDRSHRERRQMHKLTPKVMTASFSKESAVK